MRRKTKELVAGCTDVSSGRIEMKLSYGFFKSEVELKKTGLGRV